MSYGLSTPTIPLNVDLLTPYNLDGSAKFLLEAPSTFQTNISCTTGNNYFTLYSGSSYYLEASVVVVNTGRNGAFTWQFRDKTNAVNIGSDAQLNMNGSYASVNRVGRKVCSALILDSEISTSMDIEVIRTAQTGTGWVYLVDTTNHSINGWNYVGYPSVRIWQLPS